MDIPTRLHPDDAREAGLTVDEHVYPHFAYDGPRFAPTQGHDCYTELESALIRALGKETT